MISASLWTCSISLCFFDFISNKHVNVWLSVTLNVSLTNTNILICWLSVQINNLINKLWLTGEHVYIENLCVYLQWRAVMRHSEAVSYWHHMIRETKTTVALFRPKRFSSLHCRKKNFYFVIKKRKWCQRSISEREALHCVVLHVTWPRGRSPEQLQLTWTRHRKRSLKESLLRPAWSSALS